MCNCTFRQALFILINFLFLVLFVGACVHARVSVQACVCACVNTCDKSDARRIVMEELFSSSSSLTILIS